MFDDNSVTRSFGAHLLKINCAPALLVPCYPQTLIVLIIVLV